MFKQLGNTATCISSKHCAFLAGMGRVQICTACLTFWVQHLGTLQRWRSIYGC